ncbi:MAG: 3-methyladenine glycosylase [Gemmatimonadetes bacterium]|nr:3-methyladenine glycosylase [Gemmatimonadota bacterium]
MTRGAAPPARRARQRAPFPRSFYDRETELVARELLGAVLECHASDGVVSGRIVETEAYIGAHDPACHAAAGLTARTAPLYGPPGLAYVYLIYGMHWCFNAVTREEGHGSAVLVRALEPLEGIDVMWRRRARARRLQDLTNGPAKLCAALGITGAQNLCRLDRPPLIIRPGAEVPDANVAITPRIGITRAADWPLRWIVTDSDFTSRTPPHFFRRPLA